MHIIQTLFDFIFPPSEDQVRVRKINPELIESYYSVKTFEDITVLSSYENSDMRALMREAKFHNNKIAHILLNSLIKMYFENNNNEFDVIIPIPLSKKRLRERGHNQVVSILLADDIKNINIDTNILHRERNTKPQTELQREKRLKNMKNAFLVSNPEKIKGRKILLIDDVATTGATMESAKGSLLDYSPKLVKCLALAH